MTTNDRRSSEFGRWTSDVHSGLWVLQSVDGKTMGFSRNAPDWGLNYRNNEQGVQVHG